jgi:hypothetical protein
MYGNQNRWPAMFIGKPIYQSLSTTKFDCKCILAKTDNITVKKLNLRRTQTSIMADGEGK